MNKGYVSIVLHSHMPFVRHPEIEDCIEERWLFEAMNESYIPLIEVFDNLIKDDINFCVTMSITPSLMHMLQDKYLNEKFDKYLNSLLALSKSEIERTKNRPKLNSIAKFYYEKFTRAIKIYYSYDRNLMNAFKKFDKLGCIEIITCAATHALLPLLTVNPEAIKAQLVTGVESYIECFGHNPKGIWLPECAYTYELDMYLKKLGIEYFITEDKAIIFASPKPKYSTFAPIATPNGICAFGRDTEASSEVWNNYTGYPGDSCYREFYRDIAYELPMSYLSPYIGRNKVRVDTGIKYYKITGRTEKKEYYERDIAFMKAKEHAHNFSNCRNMQIRYVSSQMDKPPIIVCPYDTELFGHWWFEGPEFIDNFIRKSSEVQNDYELITPLKYLKKYPNVQCSSPDPSSWGENGDFSVWLNSSNQWIYRELHSCERGMIKLANTYIRPNDLEKRALNQAARELMLAEASDWPFIIKNNTTVNYAVMRLKAHFARFNKLYDEIIKSSINDKELQRIEKLDNIFPKIDYRIYKKDS